MRVAWSELASEIGPERLAELVRRFPGRRFTVPLYTQPSGRDRQNPLRNLNPETLQILVERFGGSRISIPSGREARRRTVRMVDVINLTAKGKTAWEIARILKCSPRTVHAKRREHREAGAIAFPKTLP